jgi:putative transposase
MELVSRRKEIDMSQPVPVEEAMTKTTQKGKGVPGIPDEIVDQLLKGYTKPEDLLGPGGLIKQLMGRLISRAMDAELTHHLGYERGEPPPKTQDNRRNGAGKKTVRTDGGPVDIEVPRDREGTFEPQLVGKHERHFDGFDDKIISMYARGMSVRDIRAHLEEIYGVDVSPELISRVTDTVLDEMRTWQARPLEPVYLVVYLDALFLKIRDKGVVRNKAVYIAVGLASDGTKEVLGLWLQNTEGAKFWLAILGELRQRGVQDILVLCADGLTGLPDAVEAAFPQAIFQTCIVHMVRSSTRFVPWKERRAVCADLRKVYTAVDVDDARRALDAFEVTWGKRFPMIVPAWRTRWAEITPFLAFPAEVRHAIYTTNAIEALNRILRKTLKTRGALPDDDSALKLLFLSLRNARSSWGGSNRSWNQALLQFVIHFEGRIPE